MEKPQIEVIKEEQHVESSRVCLKVPYTQTDEFGNEATFYRKEYVSVESLDEQIASLQAQIDALNEKKALIVK